MKREPGFYWVRFGDGSWQVAEWVKLFKYFRLFDTEDSFYESDFEEISDRILSPDEQAAEENWINRGGEVD